MLQIQHLKEEIARSKASGKELVKCESCGKMTAYNYKGFNYRGGWKKLFVCENCMHTWNEFICSEEDYDYLSN